MNSLPAIFRCARRAAWAVALLIGALPPAGAAGPQESRAVKNARAYVELLAQEDFTAAAAKQNAFMKRIATADSLRGAWNDVREYAGRFQKQVAARAVPWEQSVVVTVTCQFETERLDLRVVVDAQGEIGGFAVLPDAQQLHSDFVRAVELRKQRHESDAIAAIEQLLPRAERLFGKAHLDYAAILIELARCHWQMRGYDRAESLLEQALQIQKSKLEAGHPDIAATLNELALLNQDRGRPAQAEALFRDSLRMMEEKKGADDPQAARIRCNLARLLHLGGRGPEAEALYVRSLAILESTLPPDHGDSAICRDNLAALYRTEGQAAQGEALYLRAIRLLQAKGESSQEGIAITWNKLGVFYHAAGQYAQAEAAFRRSLAIWDELAPQSLEAAYSLNNLAAVCRVVGRYPEAERYCERGREIREARLGPEHPEVASTLNTLALIYKAMGQYERAAPLYLRSIGILEKHRKLRPPETEERDTDELPLVLDNLAGLYRSMGLPERAEPLLLRSLEMLQAERGHDDFDVAVCLNNLGEFYRRLGQYAKAEQRYRAGLEIAEKRWPDHPLTACNRDNLAYLYQLQGKYDQAEPLHRQSLESLQSRQAPGDPNLIGCLGSLAMLCEATGRTAEAAALTDRARRGSALFVSRTLPALSEMEQLQFLRERHETAFHRALSLGLRHPGDRELAASSAAWLLNGKAVARQALAENILLNRDGRDPDVAASARELLNARRQLARMTVAIPKPGEDAARRNEMQVLADRELELVHRLGRKNSRLGQETRWFEPGDLRKRLLRGAAYVDFARFDIFDFQAQPGEKRWRPARYVAWIITEEETVSVIDLGPADQIDAAIHGVRQAVAAHKRYLDQGESESALENELQVSLAGLSRLILHPLLKVLEPRERWTISPDGNLWLVPWAALLLPNGRYVVEQHEVRCLVSGRDLLVGTQDFTPAAPLVFADPDFDLAADDARAESRRLVPGERPSGGTRGPGRGLALAHFERLPYTADEARLITPHLATYARTKPLVYVQKRALESVFKGSPNPRVLVLSTHGFFLPAERAEADDPVETAHRPALVQENPLLLCGLLLAGCNHRSESSDGDDGVLTGLEVVGADLRGTELVVLSACQTGLGEVRNGEGVAGLRQAFQLAGAETVLSSLWSIPDRESADLIGHYFDNLARGEKTAGGLRAAQLKLIADRRRERGSAHPWFWAAFTVTGGRPD